jgi:hypothetical protein
LVPEDPSPFQLSACRQHGGVGPQQGFMARGNIVANPHYRNRAKGDYRLDAHSACRKVLGGDGSNVGRL